MLPERADDRARALSRRDRRLAPVRALPLRRPRARRLGPCHLGAHPRALRSGGRRDLVRRRHRPSPARPRRRRSRGAALGRRAASCSSPRRWRRRSPPSSAARRCSARAFARTPSRALLIPRAYPGSRTPLWQQRLKAQSLLEVASRYADFPIVLETYRECLRTCSTWRGSKRCCAGCTAGRSHSWRSRHGHGLAVRLLAAVRLRGDLHVRGRHAQRRAPGRRAVAGPRPAARAARPGGAARADRPGGARARRRRPPAPLGDDPRDRPRRAARRAASGRRPHRRGGLRARARRDRRGGPAGRARARTAGDPPARGRARSGTSRPTRPGCTATRFGAVPPGGLPEAFLEDVADALRVLVARYARTHGPFTTEELRSPLRRRRERGPARARARRAISSAASCGPDGSEREWCDVEVLRRLRRASLAALRKEIEPADQRSLAAFLPSWQGVDRHSGAGAGVDRLREVLVALQGLALPAEIWERDVLPRRIGAYSQAWLDSLCASGEVVWVGAGAIGRARRTRGAVLSRGRRRDRPALLTPLGARGVCAAGWSRARAPARAARAGGRASSPTCSPSSTPPRRRCVRRCGISCGRARRRTTPGRRCGRLI